MVLNTVVDQTYLISRGREFQTEGYSRKKRAVSWYDTAKLNPLRLNVAVPMHKDTHSMWGGCEVGCRFQLKPAVISQPHYPVSGTGCWLLPV